MVRLGMQCACITVLGLSDCNTLSLEILSRFNTHIQICIERDIYVPVQMLSTYIDMYMYRWFWISSQLCELAMATLGDGWLRIFLGLKTLALPFLKA